MDSKADYLMYLPKILSNQITFFELKIHEFIFLQPYICNDRRKKLKIVKLQLDPETLHMC